MAEKTLKTRIVHKHEIAQDWSSAQGFTPLQAELVVYDSENEKTPSRIKIGDGKTNVNNLPFIDEVEEYWKGDIAIGYAGGTGGISDPYLIATPSQLALMVNSFGQGKYYKIINDLYMSGSGYYNWFSESADNSTFYQYLNQQGEAGFFTGYIDGNHHTIYGFQCYGSIAAFIPIFGDGEIRNLRIDESYFNSTNLQAAAFIGKTARDSYPNGRIHIENCIVGANNQITSDNNNAAAGFVGYATVGQTTTIDTCYCLLNENRLSSKQSWKANALIGETYNTPYAILNSYSITSPFNTNNESARKSTISNAYSNIYSATTRTLYNNETEIINKVNKTKIVGSGSLDSMPGLKDYFIEQYNDYPTLLNFDKNAKSSDLASFGQASNYESITETKDSFEIVNNSIDITSTSPQKGIMIGGVGPLGLSTNGDINISAGAEVNIDSVYDLNLNPNPNGSKAYYRGSEIATKQDTNATLKTENTTLYVEEYGDGDEIQVLRGIGIVNPSRWDGKIDLISQTIYKSSATETFDTGNVYPLVRQYYQVPAGDYKVYVEITEGMEHYLQCSVHLFADDGSTNFRDKESAVQYTILSQDNRECYVNVPAGYGIFFEHDSYGSSMAGEIHYVVQEMYVEITGSGTQSNPYIINSAEELAYFITNNNSYKYYKLNTDLDLSDYEWITSADMSSGFKGNIDGCNHVITGLTSITTEASGLYTGLIPWANDITISNLALTNINITGYQGYSSGGFVGRFHSSYQASFNNCYVSGKMSGKDAGAIIGGGTPTAKVTITNCGCNVDFSGCSGNAGMVADNWVNDKYEFVNCYSTSKLYGKGVAATSITNCYATEAAKQGHVNTINIIPKDQMIGVDAITNMSGLEEAFVAIENNAPYIKTIYDSPIADQQFIIIVNGNNYYIHTDELGYFMDYPTGTITSANYRFIYYTYKTAGEMSTENRELINNNIQNIQDIAQNLTVSTTEVVHNAPATSKFLLEENAAYMFSAQDAGDNAKITLYVPDLSQPNVADAYKSYSYEYFTINSGQVEANGFINGYYMGFEKGSSILSGFNFTNWKCHIKDYTAAGELRQAYVSFPTNTHYHIVSNKPNEALIDAIVKRIKKEI